WSTNFHRKFSFCSIYNFRRKFSFTASNVPSPAKLLGEGQQVEVNSLLAFLMFSLLGMKFCLKGRPQRDSVQPTMAKVIYSKKFENRDN
ncbi:MAG: hypothetical protein Q7J16_01290, partial [Candidatus Cloacimonadales bacterium]|nr:hypothetical protein [Candidatus Cloacimonadales bacterium]